jgi:hypothetical protein
MDTGDLVINVERFCFCDIFCDYKERLRGHVLKSTLRKAHIFNEFTRVSMGTKPTGRPIHSPFLGHIASDRVMSILNYPTHLNILNDTYLSQKAR